MIDLSSWACTNGLGSGNTGSWIPKTGRSRLCYMAGDGTLQLHEVYSQGDIARVNALEGCFIDLNKVFSE